VDRLYEFQVEEVDAGQRVDRLLAELLSECSRSFLQKLVERGAVTVNGERLTEKKYKVKAGDCLSVALPEPELLEAKPENLPLDIVYEDEDVAVVNKPRGMVVHPAPGNETGTMVNALLYHCKNLSSINGVIRPGIVHRIDKDTSGLLMVAKNDAAHRALAQQLSVHSITRIYQAVVFHNLKEDEGTVNAPIGRDPKNRLRMAVTDRNSKPAVTHWQVEERFGSFTRITARLETGRTHQIRVHMAHIGHPLLGDPLYGPKKQPLELQGQALHAQVLGFVHPSTGSYMEFEVSPPREFQDAEEKLRVRYGSQPVERADQRTGGKESEDGKERDL